MNNLKFKQVFQIQTYEKYSTKANVPKVNANAPMSTHNHTKPNQMHPKVNPKINNNYKSLYSSLVILALVNFGLALGSFDCYV